MDARAQIRADEVVRALAAAAAAVRLYPPTSEIPSQAVARFVTIAEEVTGALGPVRFAVERNGFRWGDANLAEGQAHVVAFAEALHAHQVGQLIIAPAVDAQETLAFVRCVAADPSAAREEGGLRSVSVASGVNHIAVIELTLRASTEDGLAGLDLTSAPLDVIGAAAARSAADWARSAAGGDGHDEVADAIGGMEAATREMATERVAQALLQLDEKTRSAVLAAAMRPDSSGRAMDGMLAVIARMKPATLARLLALAAGRTGSDPASMLAKLELPPEALRALQLMLRDSPRAESDCGVPSTIDADTLAAEASEDSEGEEAAIRQAVASADRHAAATRALSTALALARRSADPETLAALGEAATRGLSVGAFALVCEALRALDDAANDPELDAAVAGARRALASPEALADGLAHLFDVPQARDAAVVLSAAGSAGPEALLDAWMSAAEQRQPALLEVARSAPEHVVSAAGRRLRAAGPPEARTLLRLLSGLRDRRAVGVLAQALDSGSPEVRAIAIDGLASLGSDDAWSSISSCLTHPDETTALVALAAIRDTRRMQAVPALLAVLRLKTSGNRYHGLKRETIEALGTMGATEAAVELKAIAGRRIALGRRSRELRDAAKGAITAIESAAASGQ